MIDMIFSLNTLWWTMMVLYVPSCIGLVIIVLLQKGKGVGFAGAFGAGGGSDAVFGPRSSKSLPQRITYSMAGLFMLLALLMSMLSGKVGNSAAPELVEESEMSASEGASATGGALGALFEDGPAAPEAAETVPATTSESGSEAPSISVETVTPEPDPSEAPAQDAPAEGAAATPADDGGAAPAETAAPADAATESAPADSAPAEEGQDAPAQPQQQ